MTRASRIAAARHLLADFNRAVDRSYRRGDGSADWFSWAMRLAGVLRVLCQIAADSEQLLADSRRLNKEMASVIEEALTELGIEVTSHE